MGSASRYWRFTRLTASGHVHSEEWSEAKAFFLRTLGSRGGGTADTPELVMDGADSAIQKQLWAVVHHPATEAADAALALACLRCFISYSSLQVCRQLVAQFGHEHGFTLTDVLPYVLDDDGVLIQPTQMEQVYPSLAMQVLQSFDPSLGSLSTWVSRRVKRQPDLTRFLLQQGVYLVSDWAILNDTKPTQLKRILMEFHSLSTDEVKQAMMLLHSYHHVYRRERVQQRLSGGGAGACVPPTADQMQRMVRLLPPEAHISTGEAMLNALRTLAQQLRQYRIYARSKVMQAESLDQGDRPDVAAPAPEDGSDADQAAFLTAFRQQFLDGLDGVLAEVVQERLAALKRGKPGSSDLFTKGLHLFHCAGRSMGDIAKDLGLKAQYQVTRLLKLKELRADVRQRLLVGLSDRVRTLAQSFADPDQLRQLDRQLEAALEERIDALMQEAEAEVSTARPSRSDDRCSDDPSLKSLFARRLCHQLRAIRGQADVIGQER